MGTQSQTPGSQNQQPSRGKREKQGNTQQGGQDAGSIPRSDDDMVDEEAAQEGTREDAAGSNVEPSNN